MRYAPVVISGLIAAALGAALWGIIGYYLHLEIGWIAIIIGSVVGIACKAAAKDEAGAESGAIAAAFTVAAIIGGKMAMTYAALGRLGPDEEVAISCVADQILYEHSRQGRNYIFPTGVVPDEAVGSEDYPPELWRQAEERWATYAPHERANIMACPALANPDFVVSSIANGVIEEWNESGKTIRWPGGQEPEYAEREEHYPTEVWKEATARWEGLDDAGREQHIAELIEYSQSVTASAWNDVFWYVFKSTFGVLDIVFIGIGLLAAFKLGAGLTTS